MYFLYVVYWIEWLPLFLSEKDRANARAVMQARREFEDIRYSFAASRIENMMKSTDEIIPERTHFSIVMKYYLLGKKHFSQLKLFKLLLFIFLFIALFLYLCLMKFDQKEKEL